ncbi:Prokaryotic metallothionein [Tessaracoccus antarcticus]|uniref:Prokaryotic metallothionein n=1 Tax=Tessaracoccus antarcticus TaxID=2479848 RepID=UPI0018F50F9D|nr:Prokaryotic metallothionein [Tessaracoccus antarcticus]
MAVCDTCGNDDQNAFSITRGSDTGTFDSFECAIHTMASRCETCGCRILGHGVERNGTLYCCAHCSQQASAAAQPAPSAPVIASVPDKQVSRWKDDGGAISS